jgi:hypothetical protein
MEAQYSDDDSWLNNKNRWRLGLALAAAFGGLWWKAGRKRRILIDRVSERWLAEQKFESGQHPSD